MQEQQKKILVIGAGLSGLTAAEEILKQFPNAKVTILEAMDQVGGRTRSIKVKGTIYDVGAQWVGPPQKYAIELAIRSQNQLVPQPHNGTKILQLGKKAHRYNSDIPRGVGILQLVHLQTILWKLDRMSKKVPKQNPIDCPNAVIWDTMTVHTWIRQNVWFSDIRKLVQISVRAVIGCQTNQISFLFFLWYIHQNHGIQCVINIQNGLQQKKMKNGTQYMSLFLQKQLQKKGCQILLERFVQKITQKQNKCYVQTRKGEKFEGDYLIYAAPPSTANKIQFFPQLSRQRRLICKRYNMGAYSKMVLLYNRQYWKEKGYSGQILSDCIDSPVFMTYDDSRINQQGEVQPALVIFFAGGIDQQWTGNQQYCLKVVTQKLASHYSCPQLLAPIDYILKVWNHQQSIQGAPAAYLPPGVLSKIHNLRKPQGRIHWAGTQMANVSQGYMDGAIQSGIRVSKQIINCLKNKEDNRVKDENEPSSSWYRDIANATVKWFEWW